MIPFCLQFPSTVAVNECLASLFGDSEQRWNLQWTDQRLRVAINRKLSFL